MHPEIASALADERRRELARRASRHHNVSTCDDTNDFTDSRAPGARSAPGARGRRIPRYRVSWSRMSVPAIGAAGRQRSWVIVISATRGL